MGVYRKRYDFLNTDKFENEYIINYLNFNYYVFICFKDPDVTTLHPPPPPPPPPPGITTLRYS